LLAFWVFADHAFYDCGFHIPIVSDGGLAVDVFMIISGFVITRMQTSRAERYGIYIFRRLARIYPVYIIALIAGILASGLTSQTYLAMPWKVADHARLITRHAQEQAHFMPLLVAHLTLLHGMLPESLLPGSSLSFVPAAWSLSLEWQFYLIAPLLIMVLDVRTWRPAGFFIILAVMGFGALAGHHFAFPVPSFLPQDIGLFAIGCMSAHLYRAAPRLDSPFTLYGVCAALFVLLSLHDIYLLPFVIWLVLMCAVLRVEIAGLRHLSGFLSHRLVTYFGDRSYIFYLFHHAVMICCIAVCLKLGIHARLEVLALVFATALPITFLFSVVSFAAIERPVIIWAKRFGGREARQVPAVVIEET